MIEKRITQKRYTTRLLLIAVLLVLGANAGSASAQSTDRDSPTPLSNGVIEGENDGKAAVYYYSFTAGPGDVKITVDAKTDYYSTPLTVELSDEDSKALESIYVVATGEGRREVKTRRFVRKQPVILRIGMRQDNEVKLLTYKVRIDGAAEFATSGANGESTGESAASSSESGASSTPQIQQESTPKLQKIPGIKLKIKVQP